MPGEDNLTGLIPDNIISNPGFSDEMEYKKIIKVIGVGGGGSNAINHMYRQNINDVSFVVCNTDQQALNDSSVPTKLLIGPKTTRGGGAGNNPEKARAAAEESAEEIAKLFDDDTRMVFITAGMGGGTGTGAGPVVARIAREHDVLTVGIVTIPFFFEGTKKILKALDGAEEMGKYVDALLIINNERLIDIYGELDFLSGFAKADDTLSNAAHSISEIITCKGRINLDFEDVKTTLKNSGVAIISSGFGEGEHRVTKAIENALNSPLLKNRDVYGAKRILVNIFFSQDAKQVFKMDEIKEMREFMCNFAPDLDVIWGIAFDNELGDQVKVSVLASGFDVSLASEVSSITDTPKKTVSGQLTLSEPDPDSDRKRLEEEYGADKVAARDQEINKVRYVVLTIDDFDNDEVLNLIESTPTYGRDTMFKNTIKNILDNATEPVQHPQVMPQTPKGSTRTVTFE